MAQKLKKQGEVDEAASRQLGLGLPFLPRADVVRAPPDLTEIERVPSPPAAFPSPSTSLPLPSLSPPPSPLPAPSTVPAPPPSAIALGPIGNARVPAPAPVGPTTTTDDAPKAPRVFGVGDLVRAARLSLESRFGEVRVDGEVSGFKRSGPGHIYFCLKDDQASLECVMYSREAARLRFSVEDGMAVRLRGRLTIYEGRGRFQMSVVEIEPQGAGALSVAFEQLKRKLEAAGLFAPARKRLLPFLPRRLGVVTSPQGAVIQDIIRVAHRRFPMRILLAPTAVQGPGATLGIVFALERLARVPDVDVIILARGGGSIEDLWCFNEEQVAHAIAACRVPVISAIGHETDFTIADFVADVRAPTPSAAAALAVPVLSDLRAEISMLGQRSSRASSAHLRHARLILERARSRVADPRRLFDERRQLVDELGARAHRSLARRVARGRSELTLAEVALSRAHPHRRIGAQRAALALLAQTLGTLGRRLVQRRRGPFDSLEHKLDALSPRRVLDRGYSLAFGVDGHLLTDASNARPGDRIRVALKRGELAATVVTNEDERPPSGSDIPAPATPGGDEGERARAATMNESLSASAPKSAFPPTRTPS